MDEGNGKESSLSVPGFRGIILKIISLFAGRNFSNFFGARLLKYSEEL